MKKQVEVPKELVKELKQGLKLPKKHEYEIKPNFYKDKNGKLKFVRIYLPILLVRELKLTEKNSLKLLVTIDKNLNNEEVIMTIKR